MKIRKVVSKPFGSEDKDATVAGGINAVVSADVNESGSTRTKATSRQRIVQRGGRTEVFEEHHSFGDGSSTTSSKESTDD